MTRAKLDSLKNNVTEKKEIAADMLTVAKAINNLPKGQLKKILTEEIKEIFRKYEVEI